MLSKLGIAWRMTIFILAGAGVILGALVGFSAVHTRTILETELKAKAEALAAATACRIEGVEGGVARTAEGMALALRHGNLSRDQIYALLKDTVGGDSEIVGACAYFEPGVLVPGDKGTAPYVYRDGKNLVAKDLMEGGYPFQINDFYVLPKELGHPIWTEPYYDEGGGEMLMATYVVPIFAGPGDGRFTGLVTCDVSLNWLTKLLSDLPLGVQGYGFLISQFGTVVAHPTRTFIMNETVFSLAEERNDLGLRKLGQSMIRGESGFVPFVTLTTHTHSWLAYAPVSSTGWTVGLVFPKKVVMGEVQSLTRLQLALGLAGFVLLLLVVLFIARSITRPITQLDGATRVLASGNLDAPLPRIPGDDEVAHLSSSFAAMQRDLKAHVEELKLTTARKERVERELQIARSIQMSLIPRTFPPFIDRHEFEIYATLDPAREIGGDLYDFRLLDDDHLLIIIGDVSGKGIPAALFMAITRTLLRNLFKETMDTASVVERLNEELVQQDETSMFVTLFCAVVTISTGHVVYTNGGHNPPYVIRRGGAIEAVPNVGGLIVGIMPGAKYKSAAFDLGTDDTIFFYTDGVTEAADKTGEFFGDDRTKDAIVALRGKPCDDLVKNVRERVNRFAEGAEQSDDITIMAFSYWGPGGKPPG